MSNDKQTQSAPLTESGKRDNLGNAIAFTKALLAQRYDKPLTYAKKDGSTGTSQIVVCTELGTALGQLAPELFNDDAGCPYGTIKDAGTNRRTGKPTPAILGALSGISTVDNVTPVKSGRDKRIAFYSMLKAKGLAKDAWAGSPALADPRYQGSSTGGMKDDTASILQQWLSAKK